MMNTMSSVHYCCKYAAMCIGEADFCQTDFSLQIHTQK